MPAGGSGYNKRVTVWSVDNLPDDDVGGSIVTGTILYQDVPCKFQSEPGDDVTLLGQGYETREVFSVTMQYKADIDETDQLEIVSPYNDRYLNERFRINKVRSSSHNPTDPRAKLLILASRIDKSRSTQ